MLFTNVMKTLILIGLFIALPIALFNLSYRFLSHLYRYFRLRLFRPRHLKIRT